MINKSIKARERFSKSNNSRETFNLSYIAEEGVTPATSSMFMDAAVYGFGTAVELEMQSLLLLLSL